MTNPAVQLDSHNLVFSLDYFSKHFYSAPMTIMLTTMMTMAIMMIPQPLFSWHPSLSISPLTKQRRHADV